MARKGRHMCGNKKALFVALFKIHKRRVKSSKISATKIKNRINPVFVVLLRIDCALIFRAIVFRQQHLIVIHIDK